MNTDSATTALQLLGTLVEPAGRESAAEALARQIQAEALLVLVRDPVAQVFLPAPGLRRTLPGGAGWAQLLQACAEEGRHEGQVAYPDPDSEGRAVAWSSGLAALVAIGRRIDEAALEALTNGLPLLGGLLRNEQLSHAMQGELRAAQDAARHAAALGATLSAARGDMARTLAHAARLNQQLKEEDRRKNEFLAMLAHELRNPLSPIVTALHLVQIRQARNEPADQELRVMERQLQHLTRLVDDLLDVARITSGRIELRRTLLPLQDLLQQALVTVNPLLEERRHEVRVETSSQPLILNADPVRLVQVFSNLLNNAAKYTDAGGRIEVKVERDGNEGVVHIRDSGMGISAEVLPHVFDLFVQAPRTLDRAQGGLGIGLTLVKALVEMHGGSVAVTSHGERHGSEFTVRLPLAATVPAVADTGAVTAPQSVKRILVVDDHRDAGDMLADLLRAWGHEVELAADGFQALKAAAAGYDLILLDLGLPGMDGFEVARRLRLVSQRPSVVALSGYSDPQYRERAEAAGMDDYLVKPVDPQALRRVLADLGRRRHRRTSREPGRLAN